MKPNLTAILTELEGLMKDENPEPWVLHVGHDRMSKSPGCYGAYIETERGATLVSGLPYKLVVQSHNSLPLLIEALREAIETIEFAENLSEGQGIDGLHCPLQEFLEKYGLSDSEGE